MAVRVGTEIGDWLHTRIDPISKYIKDHGSYTDQRVTVEREKAGMEPVADWKYQHDVMVFNMEGYIKADTGVDVCAPCLRVLTTQRKWKDLKPRSCF